MVRLKHIDRLLLRDVLKNPRKYQGIAESCLQLPPPEVIQIGYKDYPLPTNLDEFNENICYGQRMHFHADEVTQSGVVLRMVAGYYFPIVTKKKWDEKQSLLFAKKLINCKVKELYPTAMHLVTLVKQMAGREKDLLHRDPSKTEKLAGIEKLAVFADLTAVDFLREKMNKTEEQVMQTSYNECLVRFLHAKELAAFQDRYMDQVKRESQTKKP